MTLIVADINCAHHKITSYIDYSSSFISFCNIFYDLNKFKSSLEDHSTHTHNLQEINFKHTYEGINKIAVSWRLSIYFCKI